MSNPLTGAATAESNAPLKSPFETAGTVSLGTGCLGQRGLVAAIHAPSVELERMLLEIGFVEGTQVEILHQGPFGRDPIAVRVGGIRVALRRLEASAVLICPAEELK